MSWEEKIEMRRQEDKGRVPFQALQRTFHSFEGQSMNMWAWTLSSQPHSSSQRGPENRALTLLFPARCFSLWHKPFMARETGASSQKCIERSTVTFQRAKACQPLAVLPFALHRSNGIHLPSHSGPLLLVAEATHLKKILAQSILIFSGSLSLLLLSLKWAQIDKMESFLLGTDFGNQRTLGKPGPHLSPHPCSSACKVPRRKFVSPAVLWHFYCLIIPLYGNLHRYGPAANETNRHKMLGIS